MKKNVFSFENCIFIFAIVYFLVINLINLSNPILERHPFRQTQTAITAYYLLDSFSFSYITPVLGDWESIPFEFPIYQAIVAIISSVSGINLDLIGRLVSLFFSLLILIPLKGIFSRFLICDDYYKLVVAGILFSPVYSFWSGAFMIESAALCFTVFAAFYVLKSTDGPNVRCFTLALLFLTLALLQKITTAIFLYGLAFLYMGTFVYSRLGVGKFLKYALFFLAAILPFIVAYSWIIFTDQLKSDSPIAVLKLTSQALGAWNYGTVSQRLSDFFYIDTIYKQDILPNTLFGLLTLLSIKYIFVGKDSRLRNFLIALLFLYLTPLFVFTNLFCVHDYYHYANVIYLISFSYLGFLYSAKDGILNKFKYLILSISYATSIFVFYVEYAPEKFLDAKTSRTIKVSDFIRASTHPWQKVIVFGFDWSSEIHYYSNRKGLAVPNWIDQEKVANNVDAYVSDPNPLIAVCTSSYRNYTDVLEILKGKYVYLGSKYDCSFFLKNPSGLKNSNP